MSAAFGRRLVAYGHSPGIGGCAQWPGVLTAVESGGRSGDRRGSLFSRLLRVRAGCAWSAKSTIPSPRRYRNTRIPVFRITRTLTSSWFTPGTAITLAPAPMRRPSGEQKRAWRCVVVYTLKLRRDPRDDALECLGFGGRDEKGRAHYSHALSNAWAARPCARGTQRNESALTRGTRPELISSSGVKCKNQVRRLHSFPVRKRTWGFVEEGQGWGARGSVKRV